MNFQAREKIKSLIQGSAILAPTEKAEWLALLELMNDKQLTELEKILEPGSGDKEMGIRNRVWAQPVRPPAITPASAALPQQKPKLSHILNLPRAAQTNSPASGGAINSKIPEQQQQNNLAGQPKAKQKPENVFGKKLNSILAEKELAAGRPQFQKEIASPAAQEALGQPFNLPVPKPKAIQQPTMPPAIEKKLMPPLKASLPPALSRQVTEKENKFIPQAAKVPARPVVPAAQAGNSAAPYAAAGPENQAQLLNPVSLSVDEAGLEAQKIISENLKTLNPKLKTGDSAAFIPGINFPKQSEQSKLDNLASIREHVLEGNAARGLPQPKAGPVAPAVAALADLAAMDSQSLKQADYNSLLKKIKDLVNQYGYHETLFNLEKSPLYKAYIQTGSQILNQASGFEKLEANNLSKQQFEKFVDLLRQIQTS